MKKILVTVFATSLLFACGKKGNPVPSPPRPIIYSLIGSWRSDSVLVNDYENGILKIDTTYGSPFTGQTGIIDRLIFTKDSSVFIKNVNETDSVKITSKFSFINNFVLFYNGTKLDTLLRVDGAVGITQLKYVITTSQDSTTTSPAKKSVLSYKSTRQ